MPMLTLITTLVITLLIVMITCYIDYRFWNHSLVKKQCSESQLIQLSCGVVEYTMQGAGPVILISHGGGTGCLQITTYHYLIKNGYRVICPSKPGYMRTSLEVGETFEKQADMFAELLDQLGIKEKVGILGLSMGGPDVLQFALRHPDRVQCLIMQDAVSKQYLVSQKAADSFLGKVFLNPAIANFMGYALYRYTQLSPAGTFQQFLSDEAKYTPQQNAALSKIIMKDKANVEKLATFLYQLSPMKNRFNGVNLELALSAKLPCYPIETINAPTLVTHSRVDDDVSLDHGEFVAHTIKGAEFYQFDGCGHLFWFGEEGDKIESIVIRFLQQHLKG